MSDPEKWSPCPPGELSYLQQSLQHDAKVRTRRRFLAVGGTALIAAGGLATLSLFSLESASPQKITCREALEWMPEYRAGTLKSASQRKLIESHLAHCRRCRVAYDQTA